MSIATELQQLTSMRNRGDLTQEEFERAKERLLAEDANDASQAVETKTPPVPGESNESRSYQNLVVAILSTIAAAFSAGSALLDPSPISLLAFALFTVAATLNWIAVSKRKGQK